MCVCVCVCIYVYTHTLTVSSQIYLSVGSVYLHVPASVLVVYNGYVKDHSIINKCCILLPSRYFSEYVLSLSVIDCIFCAIPFQKSNSASRSILSTMCSALSVRS